MVIRTNDFTSAGAASYYGTYTDIRHRVITAGTSLFGAYQSLLVSNDGTNTTTFSLMAPSYSLLFLIANQSPTTVRLHTVTSSIDSWSGTIATFSGYRYFSSLTGNNTGKISTFTGYELSNGVGKRADVSRGFACTQSLGAQNSSACFSTVGQASTLGPSAAYHVNSDSANCGAGLVFGTAFDTCLFRGRAGALTGPDGTDIYTDSGYICAGTGCSSVTSTNTGIYDAGVRVMSSVSCTGATCSLTNGALSVTVTGATSATVSASITGGGSCGGSVSVLGSWSNMRVTLITGTGPGCSVPGDNVFQVVRGTACGSSGVPVCNISPGDDVSPPLTWSPSGGSGTTRIARTPSYGSTLSVSTTYYYDIRCGCTTD